MHVPQSLPSSGQTTAPSHGSGVSTAQISLPRTVWDNAQVHCQYSSSAGEGPWPSDREAPLSQLTLSQTLAQPSAMNLEPACPQVLSTWSPREHCNSASIRDPGLANGHWDDPELTTSSRPGIYVMSPIYIPIACKRAVQQHRLTP